MSLIRAENLNLRKGNKYILKDINLEINEKENWVLFGLNGCGKTTLLSILSGYMSVKNGKIYLFGREVNKENFLDLRKRIGFVSNSFFDKYLKKEIVQEIVWAGKFGTLGLQSDINDEDVCKGKAILSDLGLKTKMRYPYDCLSKGQQQRVLIARALMGNPEVLLLDEPCSGLDIIARERFLHVIEDMAEKKEISIVYVTHHTEEILPFFKNAALMRDGEIFATGSIKDVFCNKLLSEFFQVKAEVLWSQKHFFIDLET